MKKAILLILCFSVVSYYRGYGQTLSEILSTTKEATEELYSIYDLNVFDYFKLTDYDTELKKAVFKKTDDYKNYLEQLKVTKADMLKTTYYVKLEAAFHDIDYDVKRKGFNIDLGQIWDLGSVRSKPPKFFSIDDDEDKFIDLKSLPSKLSPDSQEQGYYRERLFIPVDETLGLEIENDKSNIDIYLFFTISGKENVIYKSGQDANWHNASGIFLKSDKVRIVVGNETTGKIYFDKTYPSLSTVKK